MKLRHLREKQEKVKFNILHRGNTVGPHNKRNISLMDGDFIKKLNPIEREVKTVMKKYNY